MMYQSSFFLTRTRSAASSSGVYCWSSRNSCAPISSLDSGGTTLTSPVEASLSGESESERGDVFSGIWDMMQGGVNLVTRGGEKKERA